MTDPSPEPTRSSAARIFTVLSAFERSTPTMRLKEIAAASRLPVATTFRITRDLVALGMLERNADGSFQVGLRLWQLGSLAPRQLQLRRLARPVLERLHETTGDVVQLVIEEDRRAVCIEKISSPAAAANVTEVSGRLPLHATGVGKIILAFGDHAAPDRGRPHLPRYTPWTIVDAARLEDEVRRVRQERVAYSREELTLGTASVAAPVLGEDGRLVAALGILTCSPHSLGRLAPAVTSAAADLSGRIGYRPSPALARSVS